VIINLLTNAFDATAGGGTVLIRPAATATVLN
jgi:signal transduction histidine kinase